MNLYSAYKFVDIAISDFQRPDFHLPNAKSDAIALGNKLAGDFGFTRIASLHDADATRANIIHLFEHTLRTQTTKNDALVIFVATHGQSVPDDNGEEFECFLPWDADVKNPLANISLEMIRDLYLRHIPAKHILWVADFCYSGNMVRDIEEFHRPENLQLDVLRQWTTPRVRQLITAGSKGQKVLDAGPRGHSVFIGRFMEALDDVARKPEPFITANEIGDRVRQRVAMDAAQRKHKQTPQFDTIHGKGNDAYFVFQRTSPVAQQASLPPHDRAAATEPSDAAALFSAAHGVPPEPPLVVFDACSSTGVETNVDARHPERTEQAQKVIALAHQEAFRLNKTHIGTEHILLGIVRNSSCAGAVILKNLDADLRAMRLAIEKISRPETDTSTGKIPFSPTAQKAFDVAREEARRLHDELIDTHHFLLGVMQVTGLGAQILENAGITAEKIHGQIRPLRTPVEAPFSQQRLAELRTQQQSPADIAPPQPNRPPALAAEPSVPVPHAAPPAAAKKMDKKFGLGELFGAAIVLGTIGGFSFGAAGNSPWLYFIVLPISGTILGYIPGIVADFARRHSNKPPHEMLYVLVLAGLLGGVIAAAFAWRDQFTSHYNFAGGAAIGILCAVMLGLSQHIPRRSSKK